MTILGPRSPLSPINGNSSPARKSLVKKLAKTVAGKPPVKKLAKPVARKTPRKKSATERACNKLMKWGYTGTSLVSIAAMPKGRERFCTLLACHKHLSKHGFTSEQITQVISTPDGIERIKAIQDNLYYFTPEKWQISQVLELALKDNFTEIAKQLDLLNFGFTSEQVLQLKSSPNGDEKIKTIQDYLFELNAGAWTVPQILTLAQYDDFSKKLIQVLSGHGALYSLGIERHMAIWIASLDQGDQKLEALYNNLTALKTLSFPPLLIMKALTRPNSLRVIDFITHAYTKLRNIVAPQTATVPTPSSQDSGIEDNAPCSPTQKASGIVSSPLNLDALREDEIIHSFPYDRIVALAKSPKGQQKLLKALPKANRFCFKGLWY